MEPEFFGRCPTQLDECPANEVTASNNSNAITTAMRRAIGAYEAEIKNHNHFWTDKVGGWTNGSVDDDWAVLRPLEEFLNDQSVNHPGTKEIAENAPLPSLSGTTQEQEQVVADDEDDVLLAMPDIDRTAESTHSVPEFKCDDDEQRVVHTEPIEDNDSEPCTIPCSNPDDEPPRPTTRSTGRYGLFDNDDDDEIDIENNADKPTPFDSAVGTTIATTPELPARSRGRFGLYEVEEDDDNAMISAIHYIDVDMADADEFVAHEDDEDEKATEVDELPAVREGLIRCEPHWFVPEELRGRALEILSFRKSTVLFIR